MEIKWNLINLQMGFADFFQIRNVVTVLVEFEVRLNWTVNVLYCSGEDTY
jgi:hypothetical protein